MLPRENFGRRHQGRLASGLDDGRGGEQRHHGLARADIALQQAQHALGLGEIGVDFRDGARLRRRQRIGQGGDDFLRKRPSPLLGRPARRFWFARTSASAKLAREQFVVGEPRPRGRFGRDRRRIVWMVQRRHRPPKAGHSCWRASPPATPAARHAAERRLRRLAHDVEAEALGQRIDRLDQRQLVEVGFRHHAVRMHHLQHAVVEGGCARHDAPLADRQQLLQIILARLK